MPFPLALAPAVGFLKRIPRGVWIALAVVAVLGLGTCAHKRSVKKFGDERYAAGVSYEQARLKKAADELKAKADALTSKITANLRNLNNEENRVIIRSADSLRVRGPGKAACPGHPGVPIGASGSNAASGRPDAPATGLPQPDRIALPFAWTVDNAERCDLNRAEVLTWREWHKQQTEGWAKIER